MISMGTRAQGGIQQGHSGIGDERIGNHEGTSMYVQF